MKTITHEDFLNLVWLLESTQQHKCAIMESSFDIAHVLGVNLDESDNDDAILTAIWGDTDELTEKDVAKALLEHLKIRITGSGH